MHVCVCVQGDAISAEYLSADRILLLMADTIYRFTLIELKTLMQLLIHLNTHSELFVSQAYQLATEHLKSETTQL